MTSIKLMSLVTTPRLAVLLPTNGSMSYVNICTGNGIDPTMSSFSITDYLRLLLRHPIVIPSPRQSVYGQPRDVHGNYTHIATTIMQLMSKAPSSVHDFDRTNVYRVVISCSEMVTEQVLDRRSNTAFSLTAGGPNEDRDEMIGSTGGVYILTFEEILVFIILFALDPSFDNDDRHQDEHDRNRLRRYAFIMSPLHMMYGYNNNIAGRNWLPTYFLNQYVGDEDIGSHKYYPFINHLHVYHRVAEGITRLIPYDDTFQFQRLGAGFRLFVILAFQSCGSNLPDSRACPSVRVRNALITLTINNHPTMTKYIGSRAMHDRYSAVSRNVDRNMNMLQTSGERTKFFSIFYELCTRLPVREWIDDTVLTYRKLVDHHHLTPITIEALTMAEMLYKCEQDEDMSAYIALRRDSHAIIETSRLKWHRLCLITRDHHRPMSVEVRIVPRARVEELQHPCAARVQAQIEADGARNRAHNEYNERVRASYTLRSTFSEECKVFVIPGVSRPEFLHSCDRMMPILLLLVRGDKLELDRHVHTCIDSTDRMTSCYVVLPPTVMYIIATIAKLQMYRLMLDKDNAPLNKASILTSVMEIMAVAVRYVGIHGLWILLHSFLIHFSQFRLAVDESAYEYASTSRLDSFAAASPKDAAYSTMSVVLLLWRLVLWNRNTNVLDPKQWKLQCDTLIHGLVRNNKINDHKHQTLLTKFASELNSIHKRDAYSDEAAVELLSNASNDWADIFHKKCILEIASEASIPCVMRAINYHTGDRVAGTYTPLVQASSVCTLRDVEMMLMLVEFTIGLDGAWMKNLQHHSLFTTDATIPSRTFFNDLPLCQNHASHPIFMRESISLINDPLLSSAFTDAMITNIRNKFESREKKMRDEDEAAAKIKKAADEAMAAASASSTAASSSSTSRHHRSHRSHRSKRRERPRDDSDDSSSDRDDPKKRWSPAIGAFSRPPSPVTLVLGPAAVSSSMVHVPSNHYTPGVSPSYSSGFAINDEPYVPTTPNDPPPIAEKCTTPAYHPDNEQPASPSGYGMDFVDGAWATHIKSTRIRNNNPCSPSYDPETP